MSTIIIDRPEALSNTEGSNAERRATPRIPTRMPVSFEMDNKPFVGITRNVSGGGALIELIGEMPPQDSDIELQFYIPANVEVWHKDMRGFCQGNTVRITPPNNNDDQTLKEGLVAVRFTNDMQFKF